MASIPAQFADPALKQQLISARKLDTGFQARPALCSGITALDELFSTVKVGDLIEWGIPPGLNGRLIPLQFLKRDIPASVWIYHHHGLGIFASSWISHGVDLRRLFFICSAEPVKELRPLFLEDTFKYVIIDAPKKFNRGDLAFVAAQARKQGQIVFLIRHYFLSQKQGNAHARLRLNTWQARKGLFSIQPIKGYRNSKINIPAAVFYDDA
ncbi:MAG: hypothetical protein GY763_07890 [Gammaproteobacteria bacterium]|nr:hypothetical protein [Gammaproteobacteria bacterium]